MVFAPDTGIGVIVLMNVGWSDPVWTAVNDVIHTLFEAAEAL